MDTGSQSIPPLPGPSAPPLAEPLPIPWFPSGCAALAQRPFRVILRWQVIAALVFSLTFLTFMLRAWLPVVNESLRMWPDEVRLAGGRLFSSAAEGRRIAGNARLSIVFNALDDLETGTRGDLQIELRSDRIRMKGLLGSLDLPYPQSTAINLGRSLALPWWEARRPLILGGLALLVFAALFLTWWTLGALYGLLTVPVAFLSDRPASPIRLWKLANAAQITGGFYVSVVLFAYGAGLLGLPLFMVLAPLHQPINWVYLLVGLSRLPRNLPKPAQANPFKNPPPVS